jgi:hypothetical protein
VQAPVQAAPAPVQPAPVAGPVHEPMRLEISMMKRDYLNLMPSSQMLKLLVDEREPVAPGGAQLYFTDTIIRINDMSIRKKCIIFISGKNDLTCACGYVFFARSIQFVHFE